MPSKCREHKLICGNKDGQVGNVPTVEKKWQIKSVFQRRLICGNQGGQVGNVTA